MLIVSQNISNHNITFNSAVIYRINLAWINNLQELEALLKKHDKQKIFLDLPVSRIKPPNNKYSLDGIIPILNSYENIRYFLGAFACFVVDLAAKRRINSKVT